MQCFNDLASHLLVGREIEFSYKEKQYSITNGSGRWMLCCDTDHVLLENICDFQEKEILINSVRAFEIDGKKVADIFNDDSDLLSNLVVL